MPLPLDDLDRSWYEIEPGWPASRIGLRDNGLTLIFAGFNSDGSTSIAQWANGKLESEYSNPEGCEFTIGRPLGVPELPVAGFLPRFQTPTFGEDEPASAGTALAYLVGAHRFLHAYHPDRVTAAGEGVVIHWNDGQPEPIRFSFNTEALDELGDLYREICDRFSEPLLPLTYELSRVERWHQRGVAIAADALSSSNPSNR